MCGAEGRRGRGVQIREFFFLFFFFGRERERKRERKKEEEKNKKNIKLTPIIRHSFLNKINASTNARTARSARRSGSRSGRSSGRQARFSFLVFSFLFFLFAQQTMENFLLTRFFSSFLFHSQKTKTKPTTGSYAGKY